jgi:hypothetical protein
MDVTASDYFIGCIAVGLTLYNFHKLRRNDYKVIYRDVIIVAGYLGYAALAIGESFNDGTILAFLASIGLSFVAASIGLAIVELILSIRVRLGHTLDFSAHVDKSIRWLVVSVLVLYVINIAYDGFMQEQGIRIDLLCADTAGMFMTLFCLERARQQMRVVRPNAAAESS